MIELIRNLCRPWADMWEVAVWEDSMAGDSGEIYLTYQVHNGAITFLENIDATHWQVSKKMVRNDYVIPEKGIISQMADQADRLCRSKRAGCGL